MVMVGLPQEWHITAFLFMFSGITSTQLAHATNTTQHELKLILYAMKSVLALTDFLFCFNKKKIQIQMEIFSKQQKGLSK